MKSNKLIILGISGIVAAALGIKSVEHHNIPIRTQIIHYPSTSDFTLLESGEIQKHKPILVSIPVIMREYSNRKISAENILSGTDTYLIDENGDGLVDYTRAGKYTRSPHRCESEFFNEVISIYRR